MRMIWGIIALGAAIGLLGWSAAGFLGQRQFGIGLFVLGWALVVFGIVGGNVGLLKEASLPTSRPGLMLACAGFAVACLAPLATYLPQKEAAGEAIFYFGFALVLIGLALQFVKVFQDKSARKK